MSGRGLVGRGFLYILIVSSYALAVLVGPGPLCLFFSDPEVKRSKLTQKRYMPKDLSGCHKTAVWCRPPVFVYFSVTYDVL